MSSVQDLFDRGLKVHDVDTHVTEPPDLWVSRVSRKWGDLIPLVVKDPKTGYEAWFTGDNELIGVGSQAAAGWKDFYPSFPPTLAEAIPAAWQPKPRLEWLYRLEPFRDLAPNGSSTAEK
jgi:uncharacterized protein